MIKVIVAGTREEHVGCLQTSVNSYDILYRYVMSNFLNGENSPALSPNTKGMLYTYAFGLTKDYLKF